MKKRAMPWSELSSPFHLSVFPEIVTFGFVTQELSPTTFLQWLSKNEIDGYSRGRVGLRSESEAVNARKEGRYLGFTRGGKRRLVSFKRVMKYIGDIVPNWKKFNQDCVWLQFKPEKNIVVEYLLWKEGSDMVSISISAPRKNILPALRFLFKTLNNPDFTPIIAPPTQEIINKRHELEE